MGNLWKAGLMFSFAMALAAPMASASESVTDGELTTAEIVGNDSGDYYWVCYATDSRGQSFRGRAYRHHEAQQYVIEKCNSRGIAPCYLGACERRF